MVGGGGGEEWKSWRRLGASRSELGGAGAGWGEGGGGGGGGGECGEEVAVEAGGGWLRSVFLFGLPYISRNHFQPHRTLFPAIFPAI